MGKKDGEGGGEDLGLGDEATAIDAPTARPSNSSLVALNRHKLERSKATKATSSQLSSIDASLARPLARQSGAVVGSGR